jgi:hypothetical protein
LSPTHPTLTLIPTHLRSLHFIRFLFKSSSPPLHSQNLCLFCLCHSSLHTATPSIATLSFCYITPNFSTELTEDYTDVEG